MVHKIIQYFSQCIAGNGSYIYYWESKGLSDEKINSIKTPNHSYDNDNYPTLQNALFGAVKLTKNPEIDKYGYSGYGIGFDGKNIFHIQAVEMQKM